MRILFSHTPPDLYGASRSLLRLSGRLVHDGHTVCVLLGADGPLCAALEAAGVTVRVCPWLAAIDRRKCSSLKNYCSLALMFGTSLIKFWRVTREFKPDIIHTNTALIPTPGVVATMMRIPHVWYIREVFSDFTDLWKRYEPFVGFFSTQIVCVSQAVADQFSHPRACRKIRVLHNGFPRDEFPEVSEKTIRAFRSRYGLNGNPVIGLVGRIKIGRKGQDVLLEAAGGIKPQFPDARFMLIGSPFPGNEEHLKIVRGLIEQFNLKEEVIYTGDIDDIKTAYAALDVCVQASVLPEAFSGVVIEAMAMGKAVVATDLGSAREQIESGRNGILIAPGSVEELQAALTKLLADESLRDTLGRNARKKFLNSFEFEAFYTSVSDLYRHILHTRNAIA